MGILEEKSMKHEKLSAYQDVATCVVEGVEHPILLRLNTIDRYVYEEIFEHNCYDIEMIKKGDLKL